MLPTLRPGDIVWVVKPQSLRRGDIVVVRKEGRLIKRIVGLPGEAIALRSGRLYVNEIPVEEPYVSPAAYLEPQRDQTVMIEPETYFLLGDARDDSLDSRRLGAVLRREIEGVARGRIWPPFKMKF